MAWRGKAIVLCLLIMAGCGEKTYQPPVIVTKEVPVAVECPEPPELELPELPVSEIRDDSDYETVARNYIKTVEILKQRIEEYQKIMAAYKNKK